MNCATWLLQSGVLLTPLGLLGVQSCGGDAGAGDTRPEPVVSTWSPVRIWREAQRAASEKPGTKRSAAPGIGSYQNPPAPTGRQRNL
jgi:hypothetical protein